jgi:hypothetical protein
VALFIRGPQPDMGEPPEGSDATATRLMTEARAALDAGPGFAGPDALADETWLITTWPTNGRAPITVELGVGEWALLGRSGPATLQVDRAVDDPPAARPGPDGFGLDPGLDGWIEADGTVHLPVALQLAGKSQSSLAALMAEKPGRPLRTWAWVETDDGAQRMLRGTLDPGPIEPALLDQRIAIAADYLALHLRKNGKFDYDWDARAGRDKGGYNLLRHAGTVYSLFAAYKRTGDEAHYQAGVAGLSYLSAHTERSQHRDGTCLMVDKKVAKLGGSGLTLLALVAQAEVRPEAANDSWMRCLAAHLEGEIDAEGEFDSYSSDGGRLIDKDRRSLYYPGEALLALARYQDLQPTPERAALMSRASHWMVERQWRALGLRLKVLPDAWLSQALDLLHLQTEDPALAEHLLRIGETLASQQISPGNGAPDRRGSNLRWGMPNVVSVGSTAEGFAAVARLERRILPGEDRFLRHTEASVAFALRNQYTPPLLFGLRKRSAALGGFRDSPLAQTVRIDGVQHNLSGMLGLLALLETRP